MVQCISNKNTLCERSKQPKPNSSSHLFARSIHVKKPKDTAENLTESNAVRCIEHDPNLCHHATAQNHTCMTTVCVQCVCVCARRGHSRSTSIMKLEPSRLFQHSTITATQICLPPITFIPICVVGFCLQVHQRRFCLVASVRTE